eukprot:s3061_g4.t1
MELLKEDWNGFICIVTGRLCHARRLRAQWSLGRGGFETVGASSSCGSLRDGRGLRKRCGSIKNRSGAGARICERT